MSANPRPSAVLDASDRVDLDGLFRGTAPIGDGTDLAAPSVFASQDEVEGEFLERIRAGRPSGIPGRPARTTENQRCSRRSSDRHRSEAGYALILTA